MDSLYHKGIEPVRVRYAPSPTGDPHVGNIRAALFDWLYAKKSQGSFILRIEDTDQSRLVPGATDRIMEALKWLGLDWDEGPDIGGPYGPYIQSERQSLGLYQRAVEKLLVNEKAYWCYCTSERLAEMRKSQQAQKIPPGYDRRCRELTKSEQKSLHQENPNPVVRFAMPRAGSLTVKDIVRGDVTFDLSLLDDFVILKSDSFPTYHLAHIVDDQAMKISHVLRGEEWLPSLPRHQILCEALGYNMPYTAHLPLILGPDKSKLSKRHGARATLELRDEGYLPDAVINFLALLGWSLDDHTDLISKQQLIDGFSLERIGSSPAIFDVQKLDWFNGVYIRGMSISQLLDYVKPFLESGLPMDVKRPLDSGYLMKVLELERERIKNLSDVTDLMAFFFVEQPTYNPLLLIPQPLNRDDVLDLFNKSKSMIDKIVDWDSVTLESNFRELASDLKVKTSAFFGATRIALTGSKAAPPLFDTMQLLGKDAVIKRIESAIFFLNAMPSAC